MLVSRKKFRVPREKRRPLMAAGRKGRWAERSSEEKSSEESEASAEMAPCHPPTEMFVGKKTPRKQWHEENSGRKKEREQEAVPGEKN